MDREGARRFVQDEVNRHPVVVFSQTFCPHSAEAKIALSGVVDPEKVDVVELDQRPDGEEIKEALRDMTGAGTTPRVFIGGRFTGGGDETAEQLMDGRLQRQLAEAGAL